MYFTGEGVPKDAAEAYAWYNLSAISDNGAREWRDTLGKNLTPEQKARAQERSTHLHKEIEARMNADRK
jgi:TPR repeat protein